jgi:hypothetical protein
MMPKPMRRANSDWKISIIGGKYTDAVLFSPKRMQRSTEILVKRGGLNRSMQQHLM